ncbi:SDR family oxidoreductase [Pseudoxanthomonas dokdonensis]|uniref:Short-chain dehydrogenase n=1 Tax=Pseudoxanthomonas dokdonensis TaxID=344882 RepID=A0A0R0CM19_9GAMM|nr:SDR family oxidoreductase [Pseudoxanthomonas dokdonensis]KRG70619.1 short-chain dehydrogenase [Pseudoxanthomonas dokdonensis]
MDLDLTGKHALVCGGSVGIGRAAAIELALLGADVTVLARHEAALREVADALPRPGDAQRHGWLVADGNDIAALRQQVAALAAQRPLQILVNNSGGPPGGRAIDADASQYLAAFQQHLLANQSLAQCVVPGMQAAGWGRIINVVSTSVKEPIANLGVSNSIRGAVASWAKTLSRELGGDGITVNNVLPGYTLTRRLQQILDDRVASSGDSADQVSARMLASVPAGRFADAREVAAAIAFLASPAAAYINGVSLAVDGGRMQSI